MSNFNSDLRQLRNAISLLISGVMRDVDNGGSAPDGDASALQQIGDAILAELHDWDFAPCESYLFDSLVELAEAGETDLRAVVDKNGTQHNFIAATWA